MTTCLHSFQKCVHIVAIPGSCLWPSLRWYWKWRRRWGRCCLWASRSVYHSRRCFSHVYLVPERFVSPWSSLLTLRPFDACTLRRAILSRNQMLNQLYTGLLCARCGFKDIWSFVRLPVMVELTTLTSPICVWTGNRDSASKFECKRPARCRTVNWNSWTGPLPSGLGYLLFPFCVTIVKYCGRLWL